MARHWPWQRPAAVSGFVRLQNARVRADCGAWGGLRKRQIIAGQRFTELARAMLGIGATLTRGGPMQAYSDPSRATEPTALPDVEVFYLTAEESVERDEDLMFEARKRFPLATMNGRDRAKALAWAVTESGATGGYYWWSCFPGCLPDSEPFGPFATEAEALADAQDID